MIKQAIKPLLKRLVRKVQDYARAWEEEDRETLRQQASKHRPLNEEGSAYPELNSLLTTALREGGGRFRPHFTWGVLQAAHLARAIGVKRISVIEFGVAGGNGLLSLERVAQHVEPIFGVGIDVYGFDTGAGLPKPLDYRDMPNLFTESAYPMDLERLKERVSRARLMLGLVRNSIGDFIASNPAPVGFISFDLDYYSSTVDAFKLLEADDAVLLPRVHCYFDDIMAFTYSEYTGERLAIAEFNATHKMRKLSPIYGLRYHLPAPHAHAAWSEMFFIAHLFDHDLYTHHDGLVRRWSGGQTDLADDAARRSVASGETVSHDPWAAR
jgi:hypothetical protein